MEQQLFSIMDELMDSIAQTKVWEEKQRNDPAIQKANRELEQVLEEVIQYIPKSLFMQLEDNCSRFACAHAEAAILYGLQVADAIRISSSRSVKFSEYVVKRIERNEVA